MRSGEGEVTDRRPSYRETQRPSYRQDPRYAVHYRKARRDAARYRRTWTLYTILASVVIIAAGFGVASMIGGPHDIHGKPIVPAHPAAEANQAASADDGSQGEAQSQSQQPAPTEGELAQRSQEFAVDPSRTDWNYKTNGKKTVYLTIDDGPSKNTQAVLDILDRYGCKATFFVIGHDDAYFPMIAEAFKRGHTIGLHSMTHDYATVYSSPEAYYADLSEIGQVVKDQIGFVPCFIRFPGGSSNDISNSYCEGIMGELTEGVQSMGYQFYDWNLSVGDGADHTADEIAEYGTADDVDENIMLLCHDSGAKDTTVEALPRIIEHYQALGYTFEAIDRDSWVCHHGVNS